MAALLLTDDLAKAFLGALLDLARVDGVVGPAEGVALREVAAELTSDVDFEAVLMSHTTVAKFARQLNALESSPFRGISTTDVPGVAEAFVDAAYRVACADGEPTEREKRAVREFLATLGLLSLDHDKRRFIN